jgi:hypothetical protein
MKNGVSLLVILGLALAFQATAQVRDETRLTYEVIESERSALVLGSLGLTPEQEKAVAPIYDAYREAVAAVNVRRFNLIASFIERRGQLSDGEALSMVREYIDIEQAYFDVDKAYMQKFLDALPPQKVIRLFQAENKLNVTLEAELVKDIPLAR